ncbi:hypothetical protein [Pontibacter actiniarum]|nr:hypothetical protein [Pontibacter actiniarum]
MKFQKRSSGGKVRLPLLAQLAVLLALFGTGLLVGETIAKLL